MTASGTSGTAILARAPGRVNLIGEHTDYNGGYVLPVAIPQQTTVELVARNDRRVRVSSADLNEEREYVLGEEKAGQGWLDYVQGVTFVLQREGFKGLRGFDARIASEVPLGSGLSSSAALEVSLLRGLRQAFWGWHLLNQERRPTAMRARPYNSPPLCDL